MPCPHAGRQGYRFCRSEEHTSELQSRQYLVCRLLLEKKNQALELIKRDVLHGASGTGFLIHLVVPSHITGLIEPCALVEFGFSLHFVLLQFATATHVI